MERLIDNVTAMNSRLITVTPDQLRELANRMETQARENCLPGDIVMVPFTRSITLMFDPEIRFQAWKGSAIEHSHPEHQYHSSVQ